MKAGRKATLRGARGFPKPVKIGTATTRWPLSAVQAYEAQLEGNEPAAVEAERYLSDLDLAKRYGVSRQTIWRWCRPVTGGAA